MEFSRDIASALVRSAEQFAVDFDDAWQWIGYSTKQKAKDRLVANFEEGVDYVLLNQTVEQKFGSGGHNREIIMLTTDCFKSFCMMAGTDKGKDVRRYYLEVERQFKELTEQTQSLPPQLSRLDELEFEIKTGLEMMESGWTKVWLAAAEIHSKQLWKEVGFKNFEQYCEARWGWKKSNAWEIARAGKVTSQLQEAGIPIENLPTAVCQIRPLLKVDPDQVAIPSP